MLKKSLKYVLEKKGFYQPNVAVDLRGLTDDPLDALERSGINPCLIEVSLGLCRSFGPLGFGCTHNSVNPFVQSLLQLNKGKISGYQQSALQEYYNSFQPENVAEVFGIDGTLSDSLALPPNTYVYPWKGYPKMKLLNHRIHRYKKNSVSDSQLNDQHFGPQSEQNLAQHFNRLTFLMDRFSGKPYDSRDFLHDEIIAELFVHDERCVYRIRNGHHRVAALSALGHDKVEVRIDKVHVYRRENSRSWIGIREGKFSEREATTIFDQIFIGEIHSYAKERKKAGNVDVQSLKA